VTGPTPASGPLAARYGPRKQVELGHVHSVLGSGRPFNVPREVVMARANDA